ncbi:MAG: hypothetical protein ACRC46_07950 [Thermoguttaceae bacterium]
MLSSQRLTTVFVILFVTMVSSLRAESFPRVPDVPRVPSYAQAKPDTPRSRSFFNTFRRRFDPNRPVEVLPYITPILVVAGLIGVVMIGVIAYNNLVLRYTKKNGFDSPKRLFDELCMLHEILRSERQFLKLFAETRGLPDPLTLFVEPKFFLDAQQNPDFSRHRVMLEGLLIKMFGIPEEIDSVPSGSWQSGTQFGRSETSENTQWGDTQTISASGVTSSAGHIAEEASMSRAVPNESAPVSASPMTRLVRTIKHCVYRWDDFSSAIRHMIARRVGAMAIPQTATVKPRPSIQFRSVNSRIPITELEGR